MMTTFFGAVLIIMLFMVFVKEKRGLTKATIRPAILIVFLLLVYLLVQEWVSYKSIHLEGWEGTTREVMQQKDYYFAYVYLLPLNLWIHTCFMILFWWFMRTLSREAIMVSDGELQLGVTAD